VPANYFKNDDPKKRVIVKWSGHANLFFANWLNFVYQETPYDLTDLARIKWGPGAGAEPGAGDGAEPGAGAEPGIGSGDGPPSAPGAGPGDALGSGPPSAPGAAPTPEDPGDR